MELQQLGNQQGLFGLWRSDLRPHYCLFFSSVALELSDRGHGRWVQKASSGCERDRETERWGVSGDGQLAWLAAIIFLLLSQAGAWPQVDGEVDSPAQNLYDLFCQCQWIIQNGLCQMVGLERKTQRNDSKSNNCVGARAFFYLTEC